MSFQKKSTNLILISLVILGCVYTQRISIPLKTNQNENLYFSVKYGTKQCEVNVLPSIYCYSNIITETTEKAENCGASFVSNTTFTAGKDYMAPFQLDGTQATLYYTVPTEKQSSFYGVNELCFGQLLYEGSRNTLIELFQAGLLTEERVYFSLNSSKSQNGFIGEIDIGAPNQSLIKKGDNFVELQRISGESAYTAVSNSNLKLFGQKLDTRNVVYISLDSPFHQFTILAFQSILKIFGQLGIQYTYLVDQNYQVLLPSIKKLQPFELSLIQKDNTQFPITIKPSQYTRLLANGQYELLIKPLFYTSSISLSYTIFESYYVGFDLPHQTIIIAKKAEQQVHNFRGSSNLSE